MEYGSGRAATHILAAADLMTETEFGKTFGRKLVATDKLNRSQHVR